MPRLFPLACILLSFLITAPAFAQEATSNSEAVGIAFFKHSGSNPDYDALAKASPDYKYAPINRKAAFMAKEKQRLMRLWDDYKPSEDLITVVADAEIEIDEKPQDNGDILYTLHITFPAGDVDFFPFAYRGYDIAVIPQQMDTLLYQSLPKLQYDALINLLAGKKVATAKLFIEMRPFKSYINRPYNIGGKDMWALMSDIAGLSIRDKKGQRLWHYSAPWYISPVTEGLMDIYSGREEEREHRELDNPLAPLTQ